MSTIRTVVFSTLLAFALVSFQNCSPPASSRGPSSGPQQSPQNQGGTTTDNPKPTMDVSILPHSVAVIQEAQICVKDVKFKRENLKGQISLASAYALSRAAKNAAAQLRGRDITIVREGAYIDAFSLVRGEFNVVELILDDDCQADRSLTVRNAHGSFGSKDKITLRFDGALGVGNTNHQLQLNMQPMLEALAGAESASDLRRLLQDVRGTFH